MPDFVAAPLAAPLAAAAFCTVLMALNALTRLPIRWQSAPHDLAGGRFPHSGGVPSPARVAHRRGPVRRPTD